LLAASIVWRRRYPLFALAVLWYLAGHLIESTVVPLELYFEHRNYIPIIGPLFALGGCLFLNPPRGQVVGVLVLVFAICNAWFLYSFASLSGAPSFAARYWAATYPASQRAVARMTMYQAIEEGPVRAIETIDKFVSEQPQHAYMRIPQLNLLCQHAPDQDHRKVVEQLERELPKIDFTFSAAAMLFELYSNAAGSTCKGVKIETVISLATVLRTNPRYTNEPLYNQAYQKMLAAIARQQGDYAALIDHLQQAITYWPWPDLNVMMVMAMGGAGKFDAARDFIDDAEARAPVNPARALMWRRDLQGLRGYIRQLEQDVRTQPTG